MPRSKRGSMRFMFIDPAMSIEKEQMAIDHMILIGQERVVIDLTNDEQEEQADEIVIDLTNDEQAIQQVQQEEQMMIDLTNDDDIGISSD